MSLMKMHTLSLGQWATVDSVEDSPLRAHLRQLGFERGERVCRIYTDSSAFLSAYRVENTLIALRKNDAASVLVRL